MYILEFSNETQKFCEIFGGFYRDKVKCTNKNKSKITPMMFPKHIATIGKGSAK